MISEALLFCNLHGSFAGLRLINDGSLVPLFIPTVHHVFWSSPPLWLDIPWDYHSPQGWLPYPPLVDSLHRFPSPLLDERTERTRSPAQSTAAPAGSTVADTNIAHDLGGNDQGDEDIESESL